MKWNLKLKGNWLFSFWYLQMVDGLKEQGSKKQLVLPRNNNILFTAREVDNEKI